MSLKSILSTCALALLALHASAQLKWSIAPDSLSKGLPASVKLFYTNDSLGGKPFIAYYIEADLKDKSLQFTTQVGNGKRFTPAQYYQSESKPLAVVNGTFFSFQTNQNLNMVMRDGKLKARNVVSLKGRGKDSTRYYYVTRSAIGINKKGSRRGLDIHGFFDDAALRV